MTKLDVYLDAFSAAFDCRPFDLAACVGTDTRISVNAYIDGIVARLDVL